jgi:hypothetical protein
LIEEFDFHNSFGSVNGSGTHIGLIFVQR